MGRMSDLDITRQEYGLPIDTPLEVLLALAEDELVTDGAQLPMPVVEFAGDVDRGAWMEATYDPDSPIVPHPRVWPNYIDSPYDRLEDRET